jgi:hypothetical protein
MAATKRTVKPSQGLVDSVDWLKRIHQERAKLRDDNKALFDRLDELDSEQVSVESQVKHLCRTRSVAGQNITIFDDPSMTISVNGRMKAKEFDISLAAKAWPKAAFDAARVELVDAKKVEALLEAGLLHDEDADKAMLPRVSDTPAVTIKVRL